MIYTIDTEDLPYEALMYVKGKIVVDIVPEIIKMLEIFGDEVDTDADRQGILLPALPP